jgi:N-(2-amino-2-carboxyethyl)-L-glutamate synthase
MQTKIHIRPEKTKNSISDIVNDHNFVNIRGLSIDNLYLKIEALNPAGSIKLKTAVSMIRDFETRQLIDHNTRLIESSSGSLGVALSIVCAERGYRFTCVVDPNTQPLNIKSMQALGADIVMVDQRDVNGGFLATRIDYIKKTVADDSRYLWLNQYANPENPCAHERLTAKSIFEHFNQVDYLFVGAGTTGTLMGCIQFFQKHSPHTKIIAVDSVGSVTFGHSAGKRYISGLGTSQRPEIFSPSGIHALEMVPEADTIAMCRFLAQSNGILAGGSTGTVLHAAHKWRDRMPAGATAVAISPDLGERYLDTIYDKAWVEERFGVIAPLVIHPQRLVA